MQSLPTLFLVTFICPSTGTAFDYHNAYSDEDSDPNCFNRRTEDNRFTTKPRSSDSACVRRLRSSWGSHWRCEEDRITNDLTIPLLLVCKRM
jgi:hypothetical protein